MKILTVTTSAQASTIAELQPSHLQYESENKSQKGVLDIERSKNDGKSIRIIQICSRCGRSFILEKGRKSCPHCLGRLIVKTTISRKA
jgi:DNA-directed RNA polymerase subunit RPC12/RpoP